MKAAFKWTDDVAFLTSVMARAFWKAIPANSFAS